MHVTLFIRSYVYTYPGKGLVRVMRSGTDRAYSALAFNARGDMLASVGDYPDYLLTLWNWDEESIILRSKAFSQVGLWFRVYGSKTWCGTGMRRASSCIPRPSHRWAMHGLLYY